LYAISLIRSESDPSELEQNITYCQEPIGKIIERLELESYRKVIKKGIIFDERISKILGFPSEEALAYKVYCIRVQNRPKFFIGEFFHLNDMQATNLLVQSESVIRSVN
jgi:chorismate-pyruvate lyase